MEKQQKVKCPHKAREISTAVSEGIFQVWKSSVGLSPKFSSSGWDLLRLLLGLEVRPCAGDWIRC